MLFTSLEYFFFYLIVFAMYWTVTLRFRKSLLLLSSLWFYAAWDWRFLGLLAFSTGVDFFCGKYLAQATTPPFRRTLILISLISNLGLLGFFKYFGFFADSFRALFHIHDSTSLHVLLPIGISFFTFQSLSYTLDIYRGIQKPASALDFFLYVSFFPQLVAGPIVRARDFLPQLSPLPNFSPAQLTDGVGLILQGLLKKMVFADLLARYADPIFGRPSSYSPLENLLALYAFAFQIYWDFSGYTDIARGSALALGFHFPRNFALPYLATSLRDFWRRWHMSLSSWLRDYLYVSLGGNRGSLVKICRNVIATMALGGLWHGASWNFVLWGLFHGLGLASERILSLMALGKMLKRLPRSIRIVLTFHIVCLGWLLFRCTDLAKAWEILVRIATIPSALKISGFTLERPEAGMAFISLILFALWHWFSGSKESKIKPYLAAIGFGLACLYSTDYAPFLYFQF